MTLFNLLEQENYKNVQGKLTCLPGAGGLSLGFIQTGKYKIVARFEINKNAQKLIKNHAETKIYSDVCSANFREVENEVGNIDVIIEGPCQGFSNANRQKNHG